MYRLCLGFFPFFNHESTFIKTFKSKFCFHNVIKASCYDTFTVFVVKKNIFKKLMINCRKKQYQRYEKKTTGISLSCSFHDKNTLV